MLITQAQADKHAKLLEKFGSGQSIENCTICESATESIGAWYLWDKKQKTHKYYVVIEPNGRSHS